MGIKSSKLWELWLVIGMNNDILRGNLQEKFEEWDNVAHNNTNFYVRVKLIILIVQKSENCLKNQNN